MHTELLAIHLTQYQYTLTPRESYTLLVIYHVGALENSIHIIFDHESKQCAIVDPAWEAALFATIISDMGYQLRQIWVTHYHPDHTNAVDELHGLTGAKIYTGRTNEYLGLTSPTISLTVDDSFTLGATPVSLMHTPGHSSDGTCFILSEDIFVGDTLFVYGAGHCILPSADVEAMYESLQQFKSPHLAHLMLRCGHNYGSHLTTTIGEQCVGNPFLLINSKSAFIKYRSGIHDNTRTYPMSAMTHAELEQVLS